KQDEVMASSLHNGAKIMAKTALKVVHPHAKKRTVVIPLRRKTADLTTREYLTEDEVQSLAAAAKGNRHGHRDAITTDKKFNCRDQSCDALECLSSLLPTAAFRSKFAELHRDRIQWMWQSGH